MAADLSSQEEGEPISAINVTPFVDVVLVLLVIFMVTAPALMKDVLGVQLPKASHSDAKAPESLGVAITSQGQVLLNGQLVSLEELAKEGQRALLADANTQAIISADQDARHGDIVTAIDTLKSVGLNRFAFQIKRE